MTNGALGESVVFNWNNIGFMAVTLPNVTVYVDSTSTGLGSTTPLCNFTYYSINGGEYNVVGEETLELKDVKTIIFKFNSMAWGMLVYYGEDSSGTSAGNTLASSELLLEITEDTTFYICYVSKGGND